MTGGVPAVAANAVIGPGAGEMQHRKLVQAAQQFEAMFLQQMMKPFGAGDEDGTEGEDSGDAGSDTYQSLGVESMARAVSQAGGLGIARSVVESVERQQKDKLEAGKS